jgi:hypothetical protein
VDFYLIRNCITGLYQSKKGISINADLNGSLNMIRKSKTNTLGTGFRGWNTPKRTDLFGSLSF